MNTSSIRKRFFCLLMILILIMGSVPCIYVEASASENLNQDTSNIVFQRMLDKAEQIVNYTWIPQQRIETWNENPYKGKNYFEAGEMVIGMPYTLFSWELGVDSLLSLKQYEEKVAGNYSVSKYCNSVSAQRTGPAYGSCCATFVSEVFGGNFMIGDNPRHDGVYGIVHSGFATSYYNVLADDIRQGDALSNASGSHIIWVGEITNSYLTIYEQTPPVARKQTVSLDSINDEGYLIYNGSVYNIVTRSNELIEASLSGGVHNDLQLDLRYPTPFKAYNLSNTKTPAYDSVSGTGVGYIYATDECTIMEVYTNGWCKVLCPWSGYSDGRIVYTALSTFIQTDYTPATTLVSSQTITYTRSDGTTTYGYIGAGDTVTKVGSFGSYTQVIYPLSAGGYKCGWAKLESFSSAQVDSSYPTPFKANTLQWWNTSDGKTPVYDAINGNHSGNIYNGYNNEDDVCTVEEVYTNGWCKITVPGLSGYRYCKLSVFVNVISGYNIQTITALAWAQAYRRWDHGSPAGYVDIGDEIYIVSETDSMYQVVYPTSGGSYCRWIDKCAIDHTYTTQATAPTCTAQGYTTHTCSVCGDSYKDTYTDALGHSYSNGTCTRCGAVAPEYVVDENAPKIVVGNATGSIGTTVQIPVVIENNPGIVSMSLTIEYDESVLTLIEIQDAELLTGGVHSPNYRSPYQLTWANDTLNYDITANGTIVILVFQVSENAEEGEYAVKASYDYDNYDIYNYEAQAVRFEIANGFVNVRDYIYGDVDGNGKVNNLDRMVLTRYLAKWDDYPESVINMAAADVNSDGKINNLDRMVLTRHLAKWDAYAQLPYVS